MSSERLRFPGDKEIDYSFRQYSMVVYRMGNELEETYAGRRLLAQFSATDNLMPYTDLDKQAQDELLSCLVPAHDNGLNFQENFITLRLLPLRLVASGQIPFEELTPKTIELSFNTALKVGHDDHSTCIGQGEGVRCGLNLVCPSKASKDLGARLLDQLCMHHTAFQGEERAKTDEMLTEVKRSMNMLYLDTEEAISQRVEKNLAEFNEFFMQLDTSTDEDPSSSDE